MILLDSGLDNIYFRILDFSLWLGFFFLRKKIDTVQGKNAL